MTLLLLNSSSQSHHVPCLIPYQTHGHALSNEASFRYPFLGTLIMALVFFLQGMQKLMGIGNLQVKEMTTVIPLDSNKEKML